MDIRKFGLLAAWVALPISALNHGIREAQARATSEAELAEKSINGISPAPTSRPELAEMELFRRDYSLPPNYCGWYGDYNSASYTCVLRSASCINVGDYRGCCNGPTLSCASTFYSACVPSKSLTVSQSCGQSTICCSNTNFPECGTILFSSSANTLHTYTNIDCYSAGFGSTYAMQDYPPFTTDTTSSISTTSSSSTSSSTSSSSTSVPVPVTPTSTPDPESPTPIGPIVGGAVGGVAVLGLIGLGISLIMRRNRRDHHPSQSTAQQQPPPSTFPPPQQQQQQQMAQTQLSSPASPGVPPAYDPRYSYAAGTQAPPPHQANAYQMSPDPNMGVFSHPSPPIPSPGSRDPVKMAVGPHGDPSASPVHFQQREVVVNEAPATNPRGLGNNRAELA